jgi:hypothetical protein
MFVGVLFSQSTGPIGFFKDASQVQARQQIAVDSGPIPHRSDVLYIKLTQICDQIQTQNGDIPEIATNLTIFRYQMAQFFYFLFLFP